LHKEEEVEEFEGDWSSNSEEDFASSQQTPIQSDKVNLKLAQNFIFENSGLTQQQILAVIQYQNATEGEVQQNSECFLSPDQPSTSGMGSKGKTLQDHTVAFTCSRLQDKIGEASCSSTGVSNMAEASCSRTSVSSIAEASFSRTGVSSTAEASFSRTGVSSSTETSCNTTGVDNIAEASCSRTGVSNMAEASCSRSGVSNSTEASCNTTGVDNIAEASRSITGVSNMTEASCSRTDVSNTCDVNSILHKWKGNVLSGETIDESSSAVEQRVGITERNNISVSVLSPVVNTWKDSNNESEQLNSDSDSDTGFVEVTDIATLPVHNTSSEKNTLEVLIERDKIPEMEDDIFADIFCAQTSERISAINNKLQKDTGISLSCNDNNMQTGLGGKENYTFDKEDISNGINGSKEANESILKKEGKELMGNTVNQDDCKQKDLKVKRDVGISSGIELEEQAKKPQVMQQVTTTTLSSEELQKLQVQTLCSCTCLETFWSHKLYDKIILKGFKSNRLR
jgi:hypothetical protein